MVFEGFLPVCGKGQALLSLIEVLFNLLFIPCLQTPDE